jgi:hypothetical protein
MTEALVGFDDAIIVVATTLQTPILRNTSPRRLLFSITVVCHLYVGGLIVVWQMTCQTVMIGDHVRQTAPPFC